MTKRTIRLLAAVGVLAAAAAVPASAAVATSNLGSRPDQTFVTNGQVKTIVRNGDTIYVGGLFQQVGPRTGPGVGIDAATGESQGLPEVSGGAGQVHAVAADGSGGWYLGGDFHRVGGVPRSNIAHILADGSVDPGFDPSADAQVQTLAVAADGKVYAGGWFTHIGGADRNYIAALDSSGKATSWDAQAGSGTGC